MPEMNTEKQVLSTVQMFLLAGQKFFPCDAASSPSRIRGIKMYYAYFRRSVKIAIDYHV